MIRNYFDFSKLTSVVEGEVVNWKNSSVKETSPQAFPMLDKYWKNIGQNFTQEQLSQSDFQNTWPWSAAFVSWCMTRVDPTFPKAASHHVYTKKALENRNSNQGGWRLYSLSREKSPVLAQVGDVCVKPRDGGSDTNSHGDLVWKIESKKAYLAGGNLGDTQKSTIIILLNDDGSYPKNPNSYQVVLKKM